MVSPASAIALLIILRGAYAGHRVAERGGKDLSGWMGEHFHTLRDRTLMKITLPGSHNSGNYQGGLSAEHVCASDYNYYNGYLKAAKAAESPPMTQKEFDARMIPWNINHFTPIVEQLKRDGVRYFHLKTCNMGRPGSRVMDLASVRFQHRGYTTQETLASTLREIKAFLREQPKEIIALGFNNLHSAAPGGFGEEDVLALSAALVEEVGEGSLVRKEELYHSTLGELLTAGRRLLIFMGGPRSAAGKLPPGIIPSSEALAEDWDDVLESGDLDGSKVWLVHDVKEEAVRHDRYYVMQANPNNEEDLMYKAMISGKGPQSNEAFLRSFLDTLGGLVSDAVAGAPGARINVVSTDFLNISKPYDIAMRLNGLELYV